MSARPVTARACPHYPVCPGCPLVALPYARQLADKRAQVVAALANLPGDEPPAVAPVVAVGRPEGYRMQAKLVARATRHGVILGLYRRGSHHVVDVAGCPLHAPAIRRAIPVVRAALEREHVAVHGSGRRGLRYVLLRASSRTRELLITLVTSQAGTGAAARVATALRSRLPLAGLAVNHNPTAGNEILGPRTTRVWGADTLAERYGDVTLHAGPTAFVQANPVVAGRIYGTIAAAADLHGDERVVDLYAGVGGIALTLAGRAATVLGIEEVTPAVRAARANARRNRRRHVRFEAGRVEDLLGALARGSVDLVTLNPPRKGCGEAVARALAALAPPRIVYLSCAPGSFARDARVLLDRGYALERVTPFDLYPQTEHVELLGTFTRRGPDPG